MEQVLSSTLVFACAAEFNPFINIYFKEGSVSSNIFGPCVFGKFVFPFKNCLPEHEEYREMIYIEIPKWGQKKELSLILKTALYFKGASPEDIDLAKTFPSLN